MTSDELQNFAGNFRLAGIVVTFVGFTVTCVSHVVAEKLLTSQRADKAAAQERLKQSEAELKATKEQTAELAAKAAPRIVTEQQRNDFIHFTSNAPKGRVEIYIEVGSQETLIYAAAIKDMLAKSGFDVAATDRAFLSTGLRTTSLTMKVKTDNPPIHAGVIQKGFESIGIAIPGSVAEPGIEITDDAPIIYVHTKP